jgi:acyl-CoA thioesterase-1
MVVKPGQDARLSSWPIGLAESTVATLALKIRSATLSWPNMINASPFILAFGDSLVAGYGLAAEDSFPAQLERRLRLDHPHAQVRNAGVSGNTTGDALRRLPAVLTSLTARPDLAIVQLGANDVLRGVPPDRMRANLDAILREFGRCGIPILLATLDPPAFLQARTGGYLGIHADVAARHGAAAAGFFPAGVLGRADMVLFDRVHPNARAITAVVAHMLPAITQALRRGGTAAAA